MDKFSFLGKLHSSMVEQMYNKYLQDPKSIEEEWSNFFQGFDFAKEVYSEDDIPKLFQKEFKVINLIDAYRKSGHLFTKSRRCIYFITMLAFSIVYTTFAYF